MSGVTDRELVRRVQKGDDRAFDLLFHRYRFRIHGLVSRYISNQEDIEDVVQESFVKAFRALPRFRGDSEFFTWLYRIAVNSAKNFLVARSRRPMGSDVQIDENEAGNAFEALRDDAGPEALMRTDQLAEAIDDVINNLS
ncbi:MAG: sigma-70 family RNA polymerase sigma factor, partial [Pseudomonadales bacterium]|nr:sigma-70 family RNA polymerase sigma factor [Pseudomonadales bacterium]